jgi:hypothetical protein
MQALENESTLHASALGQAQYKMGSWIWQQQQKLARYHEACCHEHD